MEIAIHDYGERLLLNISGHITGIMEVSDIKSALQSHKEAKIIELHLKDALVVPSSLIGLLVKKAQEEKEEMIIKAWHPEIKELFIDLDLQDYIKVKVENE